MSYIRYNGAEELVNASVSPVSSSVVQIISETKPLLTGFRLFLDELGTLPMDNGEYLTYTTMYRETSEYFELSNDGSVYVEPEAIEEPTAEELAEEEKQKKISLIRSQISSCEEQLRKWDYAASKQTEYDKVGLKTEYDWNAIYAERQPLRDRINELEIQLVELMTTE